MVEVEDGHLEMVRNTIQFFESHWKTNLPVHFILRDPGFYALVGAGGAPRLAPTYLLGWKEQHWLSFILLVRI